MAAIVSHGDPRLVENWFASHHALDALDYLFGFSERFSASRQLLSCTRDVDNQKIVGPDCIGLGILIDRIE